MIIAITSIKPVKTLNSQRSRQSLLFFLLILSLFSPLRRQRTTGHHQPPHSLQKHHQAAPTFLLTPTCSPAAGGCEFASPLAPRSPFPPPCLESRHHHKNHQPLDHFLVSPIVSHLSLFKLIKSLILIRIYHVYELCVDCVLVSLNSSMGNS